MHYWQWTHKYGIWVPKTMAKALELGNTLWFDAIQKKLKNIQACFQIP
jgi:hypothetical protein